MTDQEKIDVLSHEFRQACHTIEFLHGCLTDPHVEGTPGGFTYGYPEQTLSRLAEWKYMTRNAPKCSAPMFSSKHFGYCPVHSEPFHSNLQELRKGSEDGS